MESPSVIKSGFENTIESLTVNSQGLLTLIKRCDEEVFLVEISLDFCSLLEEADRNVARKNCGVNPERDNQNSHDGLDVYYEIYNSMGKLIYRGEMPEEIKVMCEERMET